MILPGSDSQSLDFATKAISEGKLVGLPTETVYGIAANALDPAAVKGIFDLKGRPSDNPLIVHLASSEQLDRIAAEVPKAAIELAKRFWPGPLTLVLPKRPEVPDITTAGLDTVAVRVPAHPVALALLEKTGPLAAPSANRFMQLSPTRADAIDSQIAGGLACILDGGPCEVGIESTVLDLSGGTPTILRPGMISVELIESVLGVQVDAGESRRSPGNYPRHYSPRTPLRLVRELGADDSGLTFNGPRNERQIQMPAEPRAYASQLYGALHRLDELGVELIHVQLPPKGAKWVAINDRLTKAAESSIS